MFAGSQHYCGRKLFEGRDCCFWHWESTEKYSIDAVESYFGPGATLRTAIEVEVAAGRSLERAYLKKAVLRGSTLGPGCNLRNGILIRANLADARLSYSDLQAANFCFATLTDAYLSNCNITDAQFTGAGLFNAKFRLNDLDGVRGLSKESFRGLRWGWFPIHRILEDYPDQCEPVYRSLASVFSSDALIDDASWAAYRACVMRHRTLTNNLSSAQTSIKELAYAYVKDDPERLAEAGQRLFGSVIPGAYPRRAPSLRFLAARTMALTKWLKSLILLVVVGYGEKPARVLSSALLAILFYSLIYRWTGALSDRSFESCLYFSAITFSTVGYGDLAPHGHLRLVAASEALMGILLCGLFLFCLGRRSVGRI